MKRYTIIISILAGISIFLSPSMKACNAKATAPSCTLDYFTSLGKELNTTFTDATLIAASAPNPEYCLVHGKIYGRIGIEVSLPDKAKWNYKFLETGNGGFAGSFQHYFPIFSQAPSAVYLGYVLAETDTGHQNPNLFDGSWALNNPTAVEDFHYLAVHETAMVTKGIISHYYGRGPQYSYFAGCSTGGRQAMESSQRYPDDFDGIISGAPAYKLTGAGMGFVWNEQLEYPGFTSTGEYPDFTSTDAAATPTVPNSLLPVLQNAINAECGAADGFVDDPPSCTFNPATLLCSKDQNPATCLSAAQLAMVERVYGGPKTGTGTSLWFGFAMSGVEAYPGLVAMGAWPEWIADATYLKYPTFFGIPNAEYGFSRDMMRYLVFGDPNWQIDYFDWDGDYLMVNTNLGPDNADNTNLAPFKAHKAKLLQFQGWADYALTPYGTIDYYEKVVKKMGQNKVDSFYRLFMVPGMCHCMDGYGPVWTDWLAVIEQWVEHGVAPDSIMAAGTSPLDSKPMERPLCPYPEKAEYNGANKGCTADRHNAACFTCQ
ncbi:MAG TPA: tannase/feruloyl esterase family alpha/beta hydrolase [Syntrophobacteraceae bacterium]|nr:tannase/feruloyl esterase family alpha/beta hydrolase [Syntrophobacteraceae bacterium]